MFTRLAQWSERPFNPDMNLWGWVALFLLFLIVAGLWASVLNLLKGN